MTVDNLHVRTHGSRHGSPQTDAPTRKVSVRHVPMLHRIATCVDRFLSFMADLGLRSSPPDFCKTELLAFTHYVGCRDHDFVVQINSQLFVDYVGHMPDTRPSLVRARSWVLLWMNAKWLNDEEATWEPIVLPSLPPCRSTAVEPTVALHADNTAMTDRWFDVHPWHSWSQRDRTDIPFRSAQRPSAGKSSWLHSLSSRLTHDADEIDVVSITDLEDRPLSLDAIMVAGAETPPKPTLQWLRDAIATHKQTKEDYSTNV